MGRKRKRHEAFEDNYNRRANHNRVNLSNRPITGEVVSWLSDRGFGWIYPHEDLSYVPNVSSNAQIYVHRNDCTTRKELKEGDQVRLMLYMDDRGLGGDECSLFSGEDPSGFPKVKRGAKPNEQPATIHLFVEEYYLERILGTRCSILIKLKKETGVNIRVLPGAHQLKGDYSRRAASSELLKLVMLKGSKDGMQSALVKISKLIQGSKSSVSKMLFLLRQDQAGRFIGKGGATLKKVRGDSRRVQVNVSKNEIVLNEQKFLTISLRGPSEEVEKSLKETVSLLHQFHCDMIRNGEETIYPLTAFEHQNPLSRGLKM